nr:glycosyltransferase family 2 protein [Burkholderiales bacterium]
MFALKDRLSVVVLTYNRAPEVMRTVQRLAALPEAPAIIVVDNGSTDGTAALVSLSFPTVSVITLARNLGTAGRNAGVLHAKTPYVAFCDDDTWWAAGALVRAALLFDAFPRIAVLSAHVLVGPEEREDPGCREMAASPLPSAGLPGRAVLGFMAGACVCRKAAFLNVGGYQPRFFIGGEEALLALDLATCGWL